jgi:hypothetical protein
MCKAQHQDGWLLLSLRAGGDRRHTMQKTVSGRFCVHVGCVSDETGLLTDGCQGCEEWER